MLDADESGAMEAKDLIEGIASAREDQCLELKEASVGLPEDIWETYSAFANTEGGTVVLGISEDSSTHCFSASGVPDAQGVVADFWSTLRNPQRVSRDVMLFDGVRIERVDGKDFVLITVPRAERGDKPVSIYDRRQKKFVAWVRRGAGDYRASDNDLRLMQYDGISSADRKPLEEFDFKALSPETIRRFRSVFAANKPQHPWNGESDEDFLYHIGALAKSRDASLHPSQAGLLAFGKEYEITRYMPHYLLDYREESSGVRRWDDRVVSQSGDWSGNLVDFYYLVSERLARYFKMPFTTDETGMVHGSRNRLTEAANEALANALVHSFYGASGSLRIVLGENELTLSNPGSLLVDRRVAIAGGFSEARNPTLMRIFNFIGVSDRAGSGLQNIWATWHDEFGLEPSLVEKHSPAAVELTLPLVPASGNRLEGSPTKSLQPEGRETARGVQLVGDDDLVRLVAQSAGGLSSSEVQSMTGISQRSAQERLKALSEAGRLSRWREGRVLRYGAPR